MANSYRFRIVGADAAADGDVHLDTFVEVSRDDGATWESVNNGHRTAVLDGAAVLAITGGPGTNGQKLTALSALFKATVEAWGLGESDDALQQMEALLPGGGWPVTVAL